MAFDLQYIWHVDNMGVYECVWQLARAKAVLVPMVYSLALPRWGWWMADRRMHVGRELRGDLSLLLQQPGHIHHSGCESCQSCD